MDGCESTHDRGTGRQSRGSSRIIQAVAWDGARIVGIIGAMLAVSLARLSTCESSSNRTSVPEMPSLDGRLPGPIPPRGTYERSKPRPGDAGLWEDDRKRKEPQLFPTSPSSTPRKTPKKEEGLTIPELKF